MHMYVLYAYVNIIQILYTLIMFTMQFFCEKVVTNHLSRLPSWLKTTSLVASSGGTSSQEFSWVPKHLRPALKPEGVSMEKNMTCKHLIHFSKAGFWCRWYQENVVTPNKIKHYNTYSTSYQEFCECGKQHAFFEGQCSCWCFVFPLFLSRSAPKTFSCLQHQEELR